MEAVETTPTTSHRRSVFGLVGNLTGDVPTFIRQEIDLAKTELSEKISELGRNAVSLAVGGFVAYAGLIVFLIGVGFIIAYAFQTLGVAPWVAGFLGLAIIGLLIAGLGGIFVMKAVRSFSKGTIKPQRTIQSLQELKSGHHEDQENEDRDEHATSEQLQVRVQATEARMGDTLDELGQRLSPSHINSVVKERVRRQPYRFGAVAMGLGVFSGFLLRRKLRGSAA